MKRPDLDDEPVERAVPCRHCAGAFFRVRMQEGTRLLRCPRCGRVTEVWVVRSKGQWEVRSMARRSV